MAHILQNMMRNCVLSCTLVPALYGTPAIADDAQSVAGNDLPAELVSALHAAFGEHHARAVHAKGLILRGSFTPDPAAVNISTASVFRAAVPVAVRFSDFTGIPDIPDPIPNASPRGMALKFALADDASLDIVCHSFNGFPVATAAEFGTLFRAIAASSPSASKPTPLETFLASHPVAKTFLTTQKPPPESWATAAYFGVNAFSFIDPQGRTHPVRYRFVPEAGEHELGDAALKSRDADYLTSEIRERVGRAPIAFSWYAQMAVVDDRIDDPSTPWPESRELVKLGTVTLDQIADNGPEADRALLFMPGNLPPGIDLADPMVAIRNAAYPISFSERQ